MGKKKNDDIIECVENIEVTPKVDCSFLTIIPSELRKKEVLSPELIAPVVEPVNNIHLGEITAERLEQISEGKTVRVNFYAKKLFFECIVQPNQSDMDVLNILRNAIFCAQHSKPLPLGVITTSIYNYNNLSVALMHSIAGTGEIDAKIEVF